MAITRLPDVFPAHLRRVIWATIALQSVLLVVLGILLWGAGVGWLQMVVYFLLPVAVLQIFAFIIIGKYALEPLDFLSRTVTQISDHPHSTTPPNLNGTRHERTGFKLMVDTIYQRSSQSQASTPAVDETDAALQATVLNTLPGGVIALNQERKVIYANKLAPVMTNSKGEHVILLDFPPNGSLEAWLNMVESSEVHAMKKWSGVQTAAPGASDRRVFDIIASYEKNATGGADTIIMLFDQTQHYSVAEESLDFMALAAHELRGPITVIRGYLDILRPELEPSLSDDQRVLFDRLDVSSSRLSGYIGNILNAAKFDRRHLKLHLREERLTDIYQLVADDLALRASTQNRLIAVAFPDNLPTVAADRNSLSEVIGNFVDNAIKYSREGGQINVTAAVDGNNVRFSVQDYGVGMPGSVVSGLFGKFYRSHRSKHTVSGTGLGLYISKAIIESHGGQVGVTSTEGEGSTFSFSVPTYASVKDKLLASDAENEGIIETSSGWIKNHSMYRG